MLFKLVRTDTEEPCKIKLPLGNHVIGRGRLLECDDKRISRNHGEVIVSQDTISIRALHKNPCFYIRKATSNLEILKLNQTADLSNGDKFGLLPDTFWYEILHCPDLDNNNDNSRENETTHAENSALERDVNTTTDGSEIDNAIEETQILENTCLEGSPSNTQRTDGGGSPSLLQNNQTNPNTDEQSEDRDTSQQDENLKRSHRSDSEDEHVKRVKTEPATVKPDPDGVNPGPSNDQGAPAAAPAAGGRERCMYGAGCYRKNSQHKAQYSHPHDPDWGAAERGVCPFGAACVRRHPRHWATHTHPPGTQPPPHQPQAQQAQRPPAQRKRQPRPRAPSRDSATSDDTPDNGVILTGKRTRKVLQRVTQTDSEEEEDPFASDGSDDWQPGTDDRLGSQ